MGVKLIGDVNNWYYIYMGRLHCPLLLSLYLISSSPVNMSVVQIKRLGFWTTVFISGSLVQTCVGKFSMGVLAMA